MLFKFGLSETPLCYFCNEELETLEPFLFHGKKVNTFWNELYTILKSQGLVSTNFDLKIFYLAIFARIMMTVSLVIISFLE